MLQKAWLFMVLVRLDARRGSATLLKEEQELIRFGKNESLRYLSLIPMGNEYWLIGKRQVHKRVGLKGHDYLAVWRGCNEFLKCVKEGVMTDWRDKLEANLAHNAAWFFWGNQLLFIGGRDDPNRHGRRGVFYMIPSKKPVFAFSGSHPGCTELRPQFPNGCEYDGRFSVSLLHNTHLALYGRANLAANADQRGRFGARHVQVAFSLEPSSQMSTREEQPPPPHWGPFALVTFLDYPSMPRIHDNIYFAAVKPNPIDDGHTVLGLFPVVSQVWNQPPAIALAVSCDGQHFGPLLSIVRSPFSQDGRGADHPIDGFHVASDHLILYYQHYVPNIFPQSDNNNNPLLHSKEPTSIVALPLHFDWLHNATAHSVRRLAHQTPPSLVNDANKDDDVSSESHRRSSNSPPLSYCADHPYVRRRRRPLLPAEEARFYRQHSQRHHQRLASFSRVLSK